MKDNNSAKAAVCHDYEDVGPQYSDLACAGDISYKLGFQVPVFMTLGCWEKCVELCSCPNCGLTRDNRILVILTCLKNGNRVDGSDVNKANFEVPVLNEAANEPESILLQAEVEKDVAGDRIVISMAGNSKEMHHECVSAPNRNLWIPVLHKVSIRNLIR